MKSAASEIVTPAGLAAMLESGDGPVLIDARPSSDHERGRIPGSVNNCVYEVTFVERLATAAPDKNRPVCVIGHGAATLDARMAAEKLARAGYAKVFELREGFDGWKQAGLPAEGGGEPAGSSAAPVLEGRVPLDVEETRLHWIGRNLLNRHRGGLGVNAGFLEFNGGRLAGGEFTIDMNAIQCENLAGDPLHDVLVNHLRSDDFFDTELYPEAFFRILSAKPVDEAAAGSLNLVVLGELTLKGQARRMEFTAASGITEEGRFAAQAVLSFDRTMWGVFYGSGKYFRNLGGHLVNDLIEVHVRVVSQ